MPSHNGATLRKATINDVKPIHALITEAAKDDQMLPRSLSDIYDKLRDFNVCERSGHVVGCCALHIVWDDLAEIRSLAVAPAAQGSAHGKALVDYSISEANALGLRRVFVLTYIPGYFAKHGFAEVSKESLPHKIWADCVKCPKFPDCGEIAMLRILA
jgi:amino-acid N-acetyltransferase